MPPSRTAADIVKQFYKYPPPTWMERLSVKLYIHVLPDVKSEEPRVVALSGDRDFFVIGSAPECDVVLNDVGIQQYHAVLQPNKKKLYVCRLGTNEIMVNMISAPSVRFLRVRVGDKLKLATKTCLLADDSGTARTETLTEIPVETETESETENERGANRNDDVAIRRSVPVMREVMVAIGMQLCGETRRGGPITEHVFSSDDILVVLQIDDTFSTLLQRVWGVEKKMYKLKRVVVKGERDVEGIDQTEGERESQMVKFEVDPETFPTTTVWDHVPERNPLISYTVWVHGKKQ